MRSVTSINPGACVIANGSFAAAITDCGVTPQAQNTGISSAPTGTAIAIIGLVDVGDADRMRMAEMNRRAVHGGKREVICTARIASAGLNGRIDTTIGPANGPAEPQAILVRYIGTRSVALDVADRQAVRQQRFLEGIRTADARRRRDRRASAP